MSVSLDGCVASASRGAERVFGRHSSRSRPGKPTASEAEATRARRDRVTAAARGIDEEMNPA
ncbi:MAG: hypothetical protein ACM3ML_20260 [Micromonosporaceae bacterium]